MRSLIITGNKEILENGKDKLNVKDVAVVSNKDDFYKNDNTVLFTDDYSLLKELYSSETKVSCIVAIHDPKNPVDIKGEEVGYFLNEFRNAKPCEFRSDEFLEMGEHLHNVDTAMEYASNKINAFMEAESVMKDINDGKLNLKFDKWEFNAGHELDAHIFDISKDGETVGKLNIDFTGEEMCINMNDGFAFYNSGWGERKNHQFAKYSEHIIDYAIKRDDTEFTNLVSDYYGNLMYPSDYGDITRDDIVSGKWCKGYWVDELEYVAEAGDKDAKDIINKVLKKGESLSDDYNDDFEESLPF